jgi:hypothetical protein
MRFFAHLVALEGLASCILASPTPPTQEKSTAVVPRSGIARRSYMDSCQDCVLNGQGVNIILICACRNAGGELHSTAITIDNLIANSNGALVWQAG